MFRSLHSKLFLVMLLLVTSLMVVVGAFLMTNVTSFFVNEFYTQMQEVFGEENADFVNGLRSEAAQPNGAARMQTMLDTYVGALGIDSRNRNYYILDAGSGELLASSDDEATAGSLQQTANLLAARSGEVGDDSDITATFMDVAIPINSENNSYIIYIRDERNVVSSLNRELFLIIVQALLVGLLFSVLLSLLLSKAVIIPIEKLTQDAEKIAAGSFGNRLEVESDDEIGVLTTTFNDMASVLHSTINAVQRERNKLDTLFLHMTDGVVAYDRDQTLIHCNPAAETLLCRSASDCQYESLFASLCPFETVVRQPQQNYTAHELRCGQRYIELYFASFSDEQRGGVLIVLHDVTEQRQIEEQRREFVANVSHELRTPLTNVRSYAETIREAEEGELPPDMRKSFLDVIVNETDRMTRIVQDLLALSRFDSGRTEMKWSSFAFSAAVESVCRSIELDAQRHGHTLRKEFVTTLPYITADRGRIEQVMMNILGNAVKYTPEGGHICLRAGAVGNHVWLEVEDDGIGVPEADRAHIFERFYRVDKARSRESGGTGLGLSIAMEIVQRHHGQLTLVERPGPGTTVRLELPIVQPQETEATHG